MFDPWSYVALPLAAFTATVATCRTASPATARAHFLILLNATSLLVLATSTSIPNLACKSGAFLGASVYSVYVARRILRAERAGWVE